MTVSQTILTKNVTSTVVNCLSYYKNVSTLLVSKTRSLSQLQYCKNYTKMHFKAASHCAICCVAKLAYLDLA
jgi:hypothetical protein